MRLFGGRLRVVWWLLGGRCGQLLSEIGVGKVYQRPRGRKGCRAWRDVAGLRDRMLDFPAAVER